MAKLSLTAAPGRTGLGTPAVRMLPQVDIDRLMLSPEKGLIDSSTA